MIDYKSKFRCAIQDIKAANRYREFHQFSKMYPSGPPIAYSHSMQDNITMWCTNDYMCMSKHPHVVSALMKTASVMGVGSGGTRNISGTHSDIVALESTIARLHGRESSLVFVCGYIANLATLSAVGKIIPNMVFLSDQENHASIIEGIRHSGCDKRIFKHNDMKDLKICLQSLAPEAPKMIVFESVYSMSGDIALISEICRLAKEYNAMTYVDEVHAVGLYGRTGGGIFQERGMEDCVDIIQGTMSKGFGVIGGYISGDAEVIDAVRNFASGFIFTTSLPPGITSACRASIEYLMCNQDMRIEYFRKIALLKKELRYMRIPILENDSHIIPIMIRDASICSAISRHLMDQYRIYVQDINYPTVPIGQERIRITLCYTHTEEMIYEFANALHTVLLRFKVIHNLNAALYAMH